ncbi:testis-expressed protein 47 [Xyrauchen texanus]|uniref:testis-expressed protein 47 n=1 Tax=Xyrauchen texanus TaxID=154827 RepID=UPI002241D88D|nr:testis-expressed protein 47 [Xyrauchen texanus]
MASRALDTKFGSVFLEDRVSLFARLMENHGTVRKKFLLHRLIVVGRLPSGLKDRRTVGVHYEKLNQSLQRSRPGEDITGLLLLYPEHTLHVIECSTETLQSVLQDLRHMQGDLHSGLILEPRVLLVSHNLPSRLFQQWNYKLLSESDSSRPVGSEDQSSEKLVSETLHQLLSLGCHLLNIREQITGSKEIPEQLLKDASELIPPQAAVSRLVQMESLLSPMHYLSTYFSPLHQLLDSESVWPAVEHLQIV